MEKSGKIGLNLIFFTLYVLFGLYYLNIVLKFVNLPEALNTFLGSNLNVITAIMLILGGIFAMMALKKKRQPQQQY